MNSDFRVYKQFYSSLVTKREGRKSLGVQTFSAPILLPPSFSHKFVSFVSSCKYLYLLPALQSLYQESASFYLLLKKNIYNSLTVN